MNRSRRRLVESAVPVSAPVTVESVSELSEHFRRVVVAGPELRRYTDPRPGDVFRLFIPPAGHHRPTLPSFGDDGFPYWPEGVPRPTLRTYAVRASDHSAGRLAFDVGVWGEHPGWVQRARPGDHLHVLGMRHGFVLPAEVTEVVLVGDASALPSMAAIVESLDGRVPVTVFAEVPSPADQAQLPGRAGISCHWTVGTTSAGPGSPLEALVRAQPPPGPRAKVRIAAEVGVARSLRELARQWPGIDPGMVHAIGHWRAGLSSDQRDELLLPRFKAAASHGLDLRDLDVLEALDLELPLPRSGTPEAQPR